MTELKLTDNMITTKLDRGSAIARALFARRRAADNARWALMKIEGDLETILETLGDIAEEDVLLFSTELPEIVSHVEKMRDRAAEMRGKTADLIRKMATIMEG